MMYVIKYENYIAITAKNTTAYIASMNFYKKAKANIHYEIKYKYTLRGKYLKVDSVFYRQPM